VPTAGRPVNLWGVPAAVLIVGVLATPVALVAWFSLSQGVIAFPDYMNTSLALLLFPVPVATAVAAVMSFALGISYGRWIGPIVGTAAGLISAATIGFGYAVISGWWVDLVPTDTNRAAGMVAAWIVGLFSVTLVLCVVSLIGPVPPVGRRNRTIGLGILASLAGLLVGTFVGQSVAAVDAALQACFDYCNPPVAWSAAQGGGLVGGWVGAAVGLGVGLIVANVALRVFPRPERDAPPADMPETVRA
jgi:hypothetical protein